MSVAEGGAVEEAGGALGDPPAAVIALDVLGTVVSANAAAERLLGFAAGTLTGRDFAGLFTELAKPDPESDRRRGRLHRGDGSTLLCDLAIGSLCVAGQELRLVHLSAARRTTPARHLDALLRTALEELPEALILFDNEDRLLYFNRAYRRIFPHMPPFEQLEGAHFFEIVSRSMAVPGVILDPLAREDPEAYLQKRLRRLHGPRKGPFEQQVREEWHLVREVRIPGVGFVCLRSDITEMKRLEASLVEREELFRTLADTSPVAMVLTRISDARVVHVNPSASALFGVPLEQAPGEHALDYYVDPQDRARLVERLSRDGAVADAEIELKDAEGRRFWALLSGTVTVYGGEPVLLISVLDISQRKRHLRAIEEANRQLAELAERLKAKNEEVDAARLRAEEANRTKSDFLAMMSHELRTPLNAVLGFSSILRDQLFGPIGERKYLEYAEDIYESGAHLLAIINDILDLAKIEAGKMEIRPEWLSAVELARSCCTLVRGLADENGVEIDQEVEPPDLRILADQRAAKQMLVNLLSNACKFTPSGGRVRLRLEAGADGATVSVADTGIGMAPEEVGRALEAFGQVGRSGTSQKGTGLGLPLVQGLIELHGGRLEIVSQRGHGTLATLHFPSDAEAPAN